LLNVGKSSVVITVQVYELSIFLKEIVCMENSNVNSNNESLYCIPQNKLLREQYGCEGLKKKKPVWRIERKYLSRFSCEDAIKTIVKLHIQKEGENDESNEQSRTF
jgi:hypothetical protein